MARHFTSFTRDTMAGLATRLSTGARQRAQAQAARQRDTVALLQQAHAERQRAEALRQEAAAHERAARRGFLKQLRGARQEFQKACQSAQQRVRAGLAEMAAERRAASQAWQQHAHKAAPQPELRPATLSEVLLGQPRPAMTWTRGFTAQ